MATSQGTRGATASWKRQEGVSPRAPGESTALGHPDLGQCMAPTQDKTKNSSAQKEKPLKGVQRRYPFWYCWPNAGAEDWGLQLEPAGAGALMLQQSE